MDLKLLLLPIFMSQTHCCFIVKAVAMSPGENNNLSLRTHYTS